MSDDTIPVNIDVYRALWRTAYTILAIEHTQFDDTREATIQAALIEAKESNRLADEVRDSKRVAA